MRKSLATIVLLASLISCVSPFENQKSKQSVPYCNPSYSIEYVSQKTSKPEIKNTFMELDDTAINRLPEFDYPHSEEVNPFYIPPEYRPKEYISSSELMKIIKSDLYQRKNLPQEITPNLVYRITLAESNKNTNAYSPAGAMGLMQLMPAVWKQYNPDSDLEEAFDSKKNIHTGISHLIWTFNYFEKRASNRNLLKLTLAGYNAGHRNVVQADYKIPNFKETQDYVVKIIGDKFVLDKKGI